MFGYPTNDDYYRDASPIHKLKSVQVPMLCLNAADDVFSPNHGEQMDMSYSGVWNQLYINAVSYSIEESV